MLKNDKVLYNRGWLKNGNPPGDFMKAPRCGAKTRKGTSCMSPAMENGRCRMHGGKSTGPKTDEGRERISEANWKHGRYSAQAQWDKEVEKLVQERLKQSGESISGPKWLRDAIESNKRMWADQGL